MQKAENKTILMMEASSRQILPMAKAFHKSGYTVTTVCEHKLDLGNVTRFRDKSYICEFVDSDFETADKFYEELVLKNKYDIILPLSDFSAEMAAKHKSKWNNYGCYVAVNEPDIFNLAFDKLNTMRVCMENDIPCPYTILAENEEDIDFSSIKYPVVIKPRSSCGSIGFHIVYNEEKLKALLKDTTYGPLLVQEFIPQNGRQFNAHFLLDENHEVKTAVITQKCRWFPLDGGASTLCRTIENDYIVSTCEKLLKAIGWVGYCDLDLMEDPRDSSIRIIEINARISANVKICCAVGADVAKQITELSENTTVSDYRKYKPDQRLRCIHTDLLWFIKSPDRFKTEPSWFSWKNTTDQIWSVDDPLPFFTFSLQAVLKYKKEMRKRKR